MSKCIADEAEYLDEEMHDRLTELLNKGWTSKFDIRILKNFAKARSVNDDIYSLPTFATFAAWWEVRDVGKLSSRSPSQDHSSAPFCSPSLPFARLAFLAPLLTLRFPVTPRLPTILKAIDSCGKQEGSWPDSSTSALD